MVNQEALEPTKMRRRVDQRAHGDVDKGAVADNGIEQRAAPAAVCVVPGLVTANQKGLGTLGKDKLVALDSGERLEGRARRAPAVGAMAVHGVAERIGDGMMNSAAEAFSGKRLWHRLRASGVKR
jgi:hypothetical protein